MARTVTRRVVLAAAALGPLAAAVERDGRGYRNSHSGDLPTFRGNAARTGENPGPGPAGEPEARWQVRLGKVLSSSPSIVNDIVYIGSVSPGTVEGGALHAVDAVSGIELWRLYTAPGDGIFATPSIADGVVVVGSYDGIAIAADAVTGEERWRFQTAGAFFSSPALVDGTAWFADNRGHLHAVSADTGAERWSVTLGDGAARALASPAVADGTLFCVDVSRRDWERSILHAFDAATGEERWQFSPASGPGLVGTPVVSGGRVYVGSSGSMIHVVDQVVGEQREEYDLAAPLCTELAVVAGTIYAGTDDGGLHALDAGTGALRWTLGLSADAPLASGPTVGGGMIFAGDEDGVMHAIDAASGNELWVARIRSLRSIPAVLNGLLYVGSNDGALRVVGAKREGTPPPAGS